MRAPLTAALQSIPQYITNRSHQILNKARFSKLYKVTVFAREIESICTQSVHYDHPSIQPGSSDPNQMNIFVIVSAFFSLLFSLNNRHLITITDNEK